MRRVLTLTLILTAILTILSTIPAYAARKELSEETKKLMREAGLQVDELEWEEIDRRQQEYRKNKQSSASSNDELHIRSNGTTGGSVAVTDFTSTATNTPLRAATTAPRTAMTSSTPPP